MAHITYVKNTLQYYVMSALSLSQCWIITYHFVDSLCYKDTFFAFYMSLKSAICHRFKVSVFDWGPAIKYLMNCTFNIACISLFFNVIWDVNVVESVDRTESMTECTWKSDGWVKKTWDFPCEAKDQVSPISTFVFILGLMWHELP